MQERKFTDLVKRDRVIFYKIFGEIFAGKSKNELEECARKLLPHYLKFHSFDNYGEKGEDFLVRVGSKYVIVTSFGRGVFMKDQQIEEHKVHYLEEDGKCVTTTMQEFCTKLNANVGISKL